MFEDNYFNTGYLIVEPEDSKVPLWENSDYLVIQDTLGALIKYQVNLQNGIDYTFNVPPNAKEGADKWFKVTNPDTTGLSIINSDTTYGYEPLPHTGLKWRSSQRKSLTEKVNEDSSSTLSGKKRANKKLKGRLSPTEKVIPE